MCTINPLCNLEENLEAVTFYLQALCRKTLQRYSEDADFVNVMHSEFSSGHMIKYFIFWGVGAEYGRGGGVEYYKDAH